MWRPVGLATGATASPVPTLPAAAVGGVCSADVAVVAYSAIVAAVYLAVVAASPAVASDDLAVVVALLTVAVAHSAAVAKDLCTDEARGPTPCSPPTWLVRQAHLCAPLAWEAGDRQVFAAGVDWCCCQIPDAA